MATTEDKKAAAAVREVENRLVWLVMFGITRAVFKAAGTEAAADSADKALKEYQNRFPAIPPDGPPV